MTGRVKPGPRPLKGVRVLSLALNLPGPAALMRCRALGAICTKLEPVSAKGGDADAPGDPMAQYNPAAYAQMHEGVKLLRADLKTEAGQRLLHKELARTDVLITSFRPSGLARLGLGWKTLAKQYPLLSQVAIVGGPGAEAEVPGHDLTYLAAHGLVTGHDLPATLFADMGGSLMATEAVLSARLATLAQRRGVFIEVPLSEAARYLALPRHWGLTQPSGAVGGAHAGYRIYPCRDGRVAVAALEPHFARALAEAAGHAGPMTGARAVETIGRWFAMQRRADLERIAQEKDIPLHTLPA